MHHQYNYPCGAIIVVQLYCFTFWESCTKLLHDSSVRILSINSTITFSNKYTPVLATKIYVVRGGFVDSTDGWRSDVFAYFSGPSPPAERGADVRFDAFSNILLLLYLVVLYYTSGWRPGFFLVMSIYST